MFKLGLLTSTAMTAATLLLSGAPAGAFAQTDMHVASRDPNTRFLCTYGHFTVSAFSVFDSGNRKLGSGWTHVAVPITGKGQTVHSIRVIEALGFTTNQPFSVGIYSNTRRGFPGKLIAGGTGGLDASCGPVTVEIAPTTLKRKKTYWIEQTTQAHAQCRMSTQSASDNPRRQYKPGLCSGYGSSNVLYWVANPSATHKAYVQTHWWRMYRHSSSSSTSPWKERSTGPYLKLK